MPQPYKYTAADFERYHSGRMTKAEMHAIEKAAMEDPFLADALEGYTYTSTPVKDIDELKEKLFAKKKKKSIFLLSTQKTWLRVAALFVLIAGIGYMAWQLNSSNESSMLATKENRSELKSTADQATVPATDTPLLSEKKDIANAVPPAQKNEGVGSEDNKPEPGQISQQVSPVEKPAEFFRDQNLQKSSAPVAEKDYAAKNEIAGDKKPDIAVPRSDSTSRNEVVVTAHGITKAKRSVGYETLKNREAPKPVIVDSVSLSVKERQEFNEYVLKNIKVPADEQGKSYKGKVVLSFEINRRGNPKDIKVEQSLCKPCDEEAIRLLKQGPKWKYINDKRQSVTIDF